MIPTDPFVQDAAHPNAEQPYFLIALGAIGLLGCLALAAGTFIAPLYVPNHDWMADTISDLAAGRWEIIMDVALYGFAAGLIAVALAAAHAHLGKAGWSVGVLSLAILAVLVTIIGARNEYGDGDNEGVVIHIYLVYGLGVFFCLGPLCMTSGLGDDHPKARIALLICGFLWTGMAPIFFILPTSVDGMFERLLGLIACAGVITLSVVFIQRGRVGLR